MSDVILYVTVGVIVYTLFDLGIALVSIIAAKPLACMFFGIIDLICATALSYMIHGRLFPEFQSYILQSEVNFIPALWVLVILGFVSAVLLMLRGAQLMLRVDIH